MTSVLGELSLSSAIPRRAAGEGPRPRSPSRTPPTPRHRGWSIALLGPSTGALPPGAPADVAACARTAQAPPAWNPESRVWQLCSDRVAPPSLPTGIVDELASKSGWPRSHGKHLHGDAEPASTHRCSHPLLDASISYQITAVAVRL